MKSRAGHTFRADISRYKLKYNYYNKVSLGEALFFESGLSKLDYKIDLSFLFRVIGKNVLL